MRLGAAVAARAGIAVALDQMDGVEPVEVGEAARVVERRLVGHEHDVEFGAERPQDLGDAARAAVPRRKQANGVTTSMRRRAGRCASRPAQPVAERRPVQRRRLPARAGGQRRRGSGCGVRRAARRRRNTPAASAQAANSRWLA